MVECSTVGVGLVGVVAGLVQHQLGDAAQVGQGHRRHRRHLPPGVVGIAGGEPQPLRLGDLAVDPVDGGLGAVGGDHHRPPVAAGAQVQGDGGQRGGEPAGTNQWVRWVGWVQAANTSARGASRTRVMV